MTDHRPIRHAVETAWKHLTPDERAALKAWADAVCDVNFQDEEALMEAAGTVLDCALDEDPAFQALLIARLEEVRQNPDLGTPLESGKEREYLKSLRQAPGQPQPLGCFDATRAPTPHPQSEP